MNRGPDTPARSEAATGPLSVAPGDHVRFLDPTPKRFRRDGVVVRLIARGEKRGHAVIESAGRRYTVAPRAIVRVHPTDKEHTR